MGRFHTLRYGHTVAVKAGLGTFEICYRKRTGTTRGAAFKPDLPGAVPHTIPDPYTLVAMMGASSAIEAMAILRSAEEAHSAPSPSA